MLPILQTSSGKKNYMQYGAVYTYAYTMENATARNWLKRNGSVLTFLL